MHPRVASVVLAFAASASASALARLAPDVAAPAITPPPLVGRDNVLVGREDDELATQCAREIVTVLFNVPTVVDPPLSSWLAANEDEATGDYMDAFQDMEPVDDVDGFCNLAQGTPTDLPASLTSAWNSYESRFSSWQASIEPSASSLAAKCTGVASDIVRVNLDFMLATNVPECTDAIHRYNSAISESTPSAPASRYAAVVAAVVGIAAAIAQF